MAATLILSEQHMTGLSFRRFAVKIREQLMVKMRSDNADISRGEGELKELERTIEECRERLQQGDAELREARLSGNQDKIQELKMKDAEYTSFLESFPNVKGQQG